MISRWAGVINSRCSDKKCKNLHLGLNLESSFEHIFMKLKLLSPFDRKVKNILSLKDPFNFCQVSEAYLQTSRTCTM